MLPSLSSQHIGRLRLLWLDSIAEVGNLELQRVAWLNSQNRNPHWSFIELVESYLEQFELRDGYGCAVASGIVSVKEAALASEFHDLLVAYEPPKGDEYDHAAILGDPQWHAMCAAAQKSLEDILLLSFNSPDYVESFRAKSSQVAPSK
jgi:hypothetical protein